MRDDELYGEPSDLVIFTFVFYLRQINWFRFLGYP